MTQNLWENGTTVTSRAGIQLGTTGGGQQPGDFGNFKAGNHFGPLGDNSLETLVTSRPRAGIELGATGWGQQAGDNRLGTTVTSRAGIIFVSLFY